MIPDAYYENIFKIDYKKLKEIGIKYIFFDIDNTIVPYSVKEPDTNIKELFAKLERDFKLIIVSNSNKDRLRPFKEKLNVDTAFSARKPFKKKYKKILTIYKYKISEIACIGDQIITDIYGANRMGFTSILVNPIAKKEPFPTKISRFFEKKILKSLAKKDLFKRGEYYD